MAMRGLNSGRLSIAACSIGGAASCLAAARDHVQTRIQFGKPLAELQSVQFTLADMAQKLWVARLAVRAAAESLDKGEPTAAVACAAAKREATEMGFQVRGEWRVGVGGGGGQRVRGRRASGTAPRALHGCARWPAPRLLPSIAS